MTNNVDSDKNGNKAVGSGTTVEYKGRVVQTASCAIGIDPEIFEHTLEKESVKQRIASLRKKYEGVKIIIGVDRLDYIKGVPQKLHAFQIFLEKHPEWVGKAILFQIAVPSREKVEEYQDLKRSVNELVGKINGQFGEYSDGDGALEKWSLTTCRRYRILSSSSQALQCQSGGADRPVRFERCMSGHVYPRRPEPGLLRVRRMPAGEPGRPASVRVLWSTVRLGQGLHHLYALGLPASGQCHLRRSDDGGAGEEGEVRQALELRDQVHQVCLLHPIHSRLPC